MVTTNQNPEQIARDQIDQRLAEAGWSVQKKEALDFNAGIGVAVREYPTDTGPADYVNHVFFPSSLTGGGMRPSRTSRGTVMG
jgi:type I site-specific restriction endonuclease